MARAARRRGPGSIPRPRATGAGSCSAIASATRSTPSCSRRCKTGKRPESFNSGAPEWERGEMSAEAAQRIAWFMHAHSMAPARGAAAQAVFGEVRHLMDVGCGSGVYGIEIARAHPGLKVTLLDLAAMADEAGSLRRARRHARRGSAPPACNMFTEDWPTGARRALLRQRVPRLVGRDQRAAGAARASTRCPAAGASSSARS